MPIVKFLPFHKEIEVEAGVTLLEAEQLAGIRQDAPCGGHGKCGKCKVWIKEEEVLACQTMIQEDIEVNVDIPSMKNKILSEGIHAEISIQPVCDAAYHISVDIGTTTVVVYLLDGKTGNILGTESILNPQFPYGADVISRIQAALGGKLEELTSLIRQGVWSLIKRLCEEQRIEISQIGTVGIVANPAMQQLFLGISPENLSKPPFSPVVIQTDCLPIADYFPDIKNGNLLVVPNIAGYVGSDTMGCIIATEMYKESKMTLMIDIGTNGEMVLGNLKKWLHVQQQQVQRLKGDASVVV